MNRKSQLKFGETIGVIIIVYLVLIAGFAWYNNSNTKAIKQIYEEDKLEQAFEKYYFVINLDLLHQSQRGFVDEDFDINSLMVIENFSKTDEGKKYLSDRLDFAIITVDLYESDELQVPFNSITLYNNTPKQQNYDTNSFKTLIPVVDSSNRKNYIGVLEVTVPINII